MSDRKDGRRSRVRSPRQPEFLLVIAMLIALIGLVFLVLIVPAPPTDADTTSKDIMDYRQQLLAVIVTAFGAWIGAGAAYYFGRENLAQATESILSMRELSPRERLGRETIRGLNPRALDWIVTKNETLGNIVERLEAEPQLWFIPVVDENGRLVTAVIEEAVYTYVSEGLRSLSSNTVENALRSIYDRNMGDLLAWIDAKPDPNWRKRIKDIYIQATMDASAGDVDDQMNSKGVYLTIIVDNRDRPTHSLTTRDIRHVLLRMK